MAMLWISSKFFIIQHSECVWLLFQLHVFKYSANEIPVFWACGVTPQNVIMNSKPDMCITHSPGCMLVLDIKNDSLSL